MPPHLLAKNEKILKMANRYKIPNLNVNYFLCGQGCARNEMADWNIRAQESDQT